MGRIKAGTSLRESKEVEPVIVEVEKLVYVNVPVEVIRNIEVVREVQVPIEVIKEVPVITEKIVEVQVPMYMDRIVLVQDTAKIDELSNRIKELENLKPLILMPRWAKIGIVLQAIVIIALILLK